MVGIICCPWSKQGQLISQNLGRGAHAPPIPQPPASLNIQEIRPVCHSRIVAVCKGCLISDLFFHLGSISKRMCQIIVLSLFSLDGQCSGQSFGILLEDEKKTLRLGHLQVCFHILKDGVKSISCLNIYQLSQTKKCEF